MFDPHVSHAHCGGSRLAPTYSISNPHYSFELSVKWDLVKRLSYDNINVKRVSFGINVTVQCFPCSIPTGVSQHGTSLGGVCHA